MKLPQLSIAQFNPSPGDVRGNSARIVDWIGRARKSGAELVVFPEECVSGYCIGDHNRNRVLVTESWNAVRQTIAPATVGENLTVVVGMVAPIEGRSLCDGKIGAGNSYAVLREGRVVTVGSKTLLANDGVDTDSRFFYPGSPADLLPVEVPVKGGSVKVGIMICEDMWDEFFEIKPARLLKERGAELLVVINSSKHYLGRVGERLAEARRRVAETGLPLVYVNTVGVQDNGKNIIVLDGGSFVLDGEGTTVAQFPQFEEGSFHLQAARGAVPATLGRVEELYRALVFSISGFFSRCGCTGAVIGLSGGIDSALNAFLLVQALGRENVVGVNMPSRFSSATTRDNAAELARRLGIEYLVHPIEEVVARKRQDYEAVTAEQVGKLTYENMQARERGNILMTYAQQRGFMVVGNGNKTEFQRGYATLYGDIIGAIMPLGDVAKTDVYRLAEWTNANFDEPIPRPIITIPPSAELSDDQDIDRGLGDPFDYDVEAPLGVEIIEFERTPAELADLFRQRKLDPEIWAPVRSDTPVYDKMTAEEFEQQAWEVFRAIEATVFKRVQSPPIVKISRKAFGFDLRESMFVKLTV